MDRELPRPARRPRDLFRPHRRRCVGRLTSDAPVSGIRAAGAGRDRMRAPAAPLAAAGYARRAAARCRLRDRRAGLSIRPLARRACRRHRSFANAASDAREGRAAATTLAQTTSNSTLATCSTSATERFDSCRGDGFAHPLPCKGLGPRPRGAGGHGATARRCCSHSRRSTLALSVMHTVGQGVSRAPTARPRSSLSGNEAVGNDCRR